MKSKEAYVGITLFIVGLLYFLFQYDSASFFKILKFWPIFILLAGVMMEFIAISDKNQRTFFIMSGIFIVYGIMYTINIYNEFNYLCTHIAIMFLSLSVALLNYYIFHKKNDLILPFILLLILLSIFTFLFPIYEQYFPVINIETLFPVIFMILGLLIILKGFIRS
ncbi:hypothetical protein [Clostridium sp.]|uniref:hypothetical protein n=1 Tax=Clostridium sp. TaxID=1506 RepID=UPI002FCB81D8